MMVSQPPNDDTSISDTPAIAPEAATRILTPIPRLLLRPAEAALALGISARLLWSKSQQGEIPVIRIGKAVRYSPVALQEWINRVQSES